MSAPGGPGADIDKEATTWLIIAIVTTVFCCCPNVIAIVGAIYAYQAKNLVTQGNTAEAAQKVKSAKTTTIAALVIGFLVSVGMTIFWVFANGMAAAGF